MQCLIGKKIGMTRVFDEDGKSIPVTIIQTGENIVHQVKTIDNDGYNAIQLGFDEISSEKITKPEKGHFKKLGTTPTRIVKEFLVNSDSPDFSPGQKVGVEIFENVPFVDVTGISKGRGHAGTIKKYHFERGRKTHGNTNVRERGSAGACSYPARVFPGLRMSGQYGNTQVTIKRSKVVTIDKENGLVFLKGAIPGRNKGIVFIKKTNHK